MSDNGAITVLCATCNVQLYDINRDQLKFPLPYKLLRPVKDIDTPVEDDPVCPFCDSPFQVMPQPTNWKKRAMMPIRTPVGDIGPDDVVGWLARSWASEAERTFDEWCVECG